MTSAKFVTINTKRGIFEIKNLLPAIKGHGAICGGYARYCLSPVATPFVATDCDVFCHTAADFDTLSREFVDEMGFSVKHQTKHAKSLSSPANYYGPPIQLIKPMIEGKIVTMGSVEDILSNFDFTISRAALVDENTGIVDEDFELDEREHRLVIKNVHCPISSTLRFVKYAKKGYHATSRQIYNLFLDWDSRSPEYRNGLHDAFRAVDNLKEKLDNAASGTEFLSQEQIEDIGEEIKEHLTAIYETLSVD